MGQLRPAPVTPVTPVTTVAAVASTLPIVVEGNGAGTVHVVLPDGIDDPNRPSGGNNYDRRICRGLTAIGWDVREHQVRGSWPEPDASNRADLAGVLAEIPDGAVVLLDGLIASAVPDVLLPESGRLRLVVLVHMPLGDKPDARSREHLVLTAAAAVITTSHWTRDLLLDRYALAAGKVRVATPGVDPAQPAPRTPVGGELPGIEIPGSELSGIELPGIELSGIELPGIELPDDERPGSELLCVAAVSEHKGQDLLLAALALITDLGWHCVCVGSVTRDPAFVRQLARQAAVSGLTDRIRFAGPRTGPELDNSYAAADVLVLASRGETYGMVVTEALARGLPVIATAVGGVPEALGRCPSGGLPGLLVPPDDPAALATALRRWLGEPVLRQRLRQCAWERRSTLTDWSVTAQQVAGTLAEVAV